MQNLIILATVAFVLWWLVRKYREGDTQSLLKTARMTASMLLLLGALVMLGRGQIIAALVSTGFGASFFGWKVLDFLGINLGRSARISRFSSRIVDLEVDNLIGTMNGVIKTGKYAGRRLSDLPENAIQEVLNDAVAQRDADSAGLLQTYLYRRFSSRRENAQGYGDAGTGRSGKPGAITEQEAYDILGLKPGASSEDIKAAYRSLIKKLHPDHGGTAYLAARVNEAKEVLLNRHR